VFEVHDSVADLPGATQARKLIVQTALEFLDSSANTVHNDPRAAAELAKAYRRLGDVQGSPLGPNLGDTTAAHARYARAATLIDDALARRPGDADAVTERLVLYDRVGQLHIYAGKLADAVRALEEGIRFGNSFRGVRSAPYLSALGSLYVLSSDAKRNMRDSAGALRDAKESLRLFEGAVALDPQPSLRNDLAGAYASVGMAESELNDLQPALEHFRRGASELEALVATKPENTSWNRDLMLAYGHIADTLGNPGYDNLNDRPGALDAYKRAAAIGKRLYEADPADQRAATDYGIVLSRVETTMDDSDLQQKIAVQRESLQVLERASRVNPKNVTLKVFLAVVYAHLGDAMTATGDREAAHDALSKSAAIAREGLGSGRTSLYSILLGAERRLALNAVARGRRTEALTVARRALEVGTGNSDVQVASRARQRGLSAMGMTYAALAESRLRENGDRHAALSWLGQAVAAWHDVEHQPGFDVVQRREMREVETALARVEQLK
jgi:tetratricopeptide (TPR) repeat protein